MYKRKIFINVFCEGVGFEWYILLIFLGGIEKGVIEVKKGKSYVKYVIL